MRTLDFILFLAAMLCFAVAALSARFAPANPPMWWAWFFGWAGLFCCALDWFIHASQKTS